VIAVLCDNIVTDDTDVEAALYGRLAVNFARAGRETFFWGAHRASDGLWRPRSGTRVSAVLTATELKPWTVRRVAPRLWANPWAKRPLTVELPWASKATTTETDTPYIEEPARPPYDLLSLAADWPPGEPFAG
jgi:hypothetical protein